MVAICWALSFFIVALLQVAKSAPGTNIQISSKAKVNGSVTNDVVIPSGGGGADALSSDHIKAVNLTGRNLGKTGHSQVKLAANVTRSRQLGKMANFTGQNNNEGSHGQSFKKIKTNAGDKESVANLNVVSSLGAHAPQFRDKSPEHRTTKQR